MKNLRRLSLDPSPCSSVQDDTASEVNKITTSPSRGLHPLLLPRWEMSESQLRVRVVDSARNRGIPSPGPSRVAGRGRRFASQKGAEYVVAWLSASVSPVGLPSPVSRETLPNQPKLNHLLSGFTWNEGNWGKSGDLPFSPSF